MKFIINLISKLKNKFNHKIWLLLLISTSISGMHKSESYESLNINNNEDQAYLEITQKKLKKTNYQNNHNNLNQIKSPKINKLRITSCLIDSGFKLLITGFVITTAILGYILIYKMVGGCDEMHTACDQCTDKFDNAEELLALGKQAAETFIKVFRECPNPEGRTALIEGLAKFYLHCCGKLE